MDLIALLTHWGVPLVSAAVLLEQSGLPLPLPAPPLLLAEELIRAGYRRVRVLTGGWMPWRC